MWSVAIAPEFEPEINAMDRRVRIELLAQAELLAEFGPSLGRPRVDTLKGSKHANMKELRFDAGDGVWRAAFAFDPQRRAIILAAGDKSGVSEKRFYRRLIALADKRFGAHLSRIRLNS
ncbi:MAG: type II toxin-antitoxin system RelE/ParE family toxin [Rhodospirillaceae bacterium]|nr:type II toxin-antitoxin system RelE/ParE family toxin [Rhodospirillaceae bacterium]